MACWRRIFPGATNADLWQVRSRALELEGYMLGDIVVVDLDRTAEGGEVVCAQMYDWNRGSAQTVLRVYEPPYLITASQSPIHRKPVLVDNERVTIKGLVVASARRREG